VSQRFVEGVGLITIDDKLSEKEVQANINYKRSITPKYKEQTFGNGFNDTQSMIYRWWQKLNDENNEKGRWLEDNTKEWGQHVGYYDSIALEAYYAELSNARALNGTEASDREVNREMLAQFKTDMYYAYDNNGGDITEVQKKYGYTPEDIGVIDGLMMMMQNPAYTAGAFAGMIAKDPEMLLIGYLRIPKMIAQGSEAARKTITAATRMKPKYVQTLAGAMTSSRAINMVGRGAEGSVYGGVYEALHDITFKGHIEPNNVKRGASMGFLLGTAFGAITKTSSNSWFVDRVGSKNAEKKWNNQRLNDRWEQTNRPTPERKPSILDPKKVPKNEEYRPIPEDAILPEGLSHQGRHDLWRNDAIEVMQRAQGRILNPRELAAIEKLIDKRIENTTNRLLKKKNPDGSKLFTPEEARGIAARHEAEVISGKQNPERWSARQETAKDNPNKNRRWGEGEEINVGRKNKEAPDYVEPPSKPSDFDNILPEIDIMAKAGKPSMGKIAKAGAIGAVAGAYFADEDKPLMALMGALSFGLARGTILKGINVEIAKMKQAGHRIANEGKLLEEGMQKQATMVGRLIQKIVRLPKEQIKFLDHVENFSKKGRKAQIIKEHGQEYYNAVQAFHNTMESFWKMANEAGVLKDTSHIKDYVTHIFGKELSPKEMKRLQEAFNELGKDKKFNFGHQRKIFKTIEEIAKERNIVFDPVKILAGYTQSLQKVLAGKVIVKHLDGTGYRIGNKVIGIAVDISNKVDAKVAQANGYKVSEMPALKGKLLHPLIKRALEDYYKPSIGSQGLAGKAAVLNNAMKRIILSASLFHAQALLLSGVYSGALGALLTKTGRENMRITRAVLSARWDVNAIVRDKNGVVIKVRDMNGKLIDLKGDFAQAEMIREIVEARLGIGSQKTNELTNAGYRTVKDFLDRRVKPLGKAQDVIDRITWDYIHDYAKMFTYLTVKQRLMTGNQGRLGFKHENIPEMEARQMAAQYANDAFGGQNFNKLSLEWERLAIENANNPKGVFYQWASLAASPTRKGLLNWLLLSPDWTISNINIAFKGLGYTKNIASKILSRQKLTAKEAAEWNLYMGYMFRAGVSTSFFAYFLHGIFAEEHKEFDLKDFWLTGRLDLGNGEEMVISKQIAEPMHWLTNPMHEGLNKGASLPKAALELLLGKQWVSLKHGGTITGPKFDRGDPKDWANWFGNKVTPISINPFKQAWLDDDVPAGRAMFQKAILGFTGFPKYGKPDKKQFKIY